MGPIRDNSADYEDLTDKVLRAFLKMHAQQNKETVSVDKLDEIVHERFRMNMKDSFTRSFMQSPFVLCTTVVKHHGLVWILRIEKRVAVFHVLSAVPHIVIRNSLEADLYFAERCLCKDFKGFM